jgi:protein-S-isoprenylcysteine O-methyltransferase Ste14
MTRLIALLYGGLAHLLFLFGVGWMAVGLYDGLQAGLGPWQGRTALAVNLALVLQFPVLHSYLLGPGRRYLARTAPAAHARTLSTTLYAAFASVQLLLVFGLWSPSGIVWWQPSGTLLVAFQTAYAACWLLLLKSMWDAGLGIQTGYLGWTSLWRGQAPNYGLFPQTGLFKTCRQPVYLSFALILWTGPVWTPDRLLLALVWSLYCYLGPRLKEQRYLQLFGPAFAAYQRRVSYFLPRLPRSLGSRSTFWQL